MSFIETAENSRKIEDVYPSRIHSHAEMLDRLDPVVHGKGEGPLAAEMVEFYRSNGFLFLENFFTGNELDLYRNELNKLWQISQDSPRDEVIREPGGSEVRSIFAVHRDNDVFAEMSKKRKLLDIVMQLLSTEVYVHQSRINFKPGFTGKEFYWHSDFETWHVEDGMPRMHALSCSIALEDNYLFNGPLMVVPGSHLKYVTCIGETPEENYKNSLRKQVYGTPDPNSLTRLVEAGGIATPVGNKGSVLLFDCNIMHGSNSNITPFPRSNVFMVFNSVENQLTAPFSGNEPRPEYIAHRQTRV